MRGPNTLVKVAAIGAALASAPEATAQVPAGYEAYMCGQGTGGVEYQPVSPTGGAEEPACYSETPAGIAAAYTQELRDNDGVLPPFLGGEDVVGRQGGRDFRESHALVGRTNGERFYLEVVTNEKKPGSVDDYWVRPIVNGKDLLEVPNRTTFAPTSEYAVSFPKIVTTGILKINRRGDLTTYVSSTDPTTYGKKFKATIGKKALSNNGVVIASR
jgi:hypothetical protein